MTAFEEERYLSWGRIPRLLPAAVLSPPWRDPAPELGPGAAEGSLLPFGQGRSYGDVCLNEGGTIIDTQGLNRFVDFDETTGRLRCEAGVTLDQILRLVVPRGWFLPTTPGTRFVSVGGAIANDVHGKNHHRAGTFGCHVLAMELLRSDGQQLRLSAEENTELYAATIGGLGLTGLILTAELQLVAISSPYIDMERIRFDGLDGFFALSEESDGRFESTVAWVDCFATGRKLGRGVFMRGNHAEGPRERLRDVWQGPAVRLPLDLPPALLNGFTLRAGNTAYFWGPLLRKVRRRQHYQSFFYPLDIIGEWNRAYGRRGFLQYQCVVPAEDERARTREILERVSESGRASFLAVLKKFGDRPSPGMLSFPRPGVTLCLDFPNQGAPTFELLDRLDAIVTDAGGAGYPAKDLRMAPASFRAWFPQWEAFSRYVDPHFSSSFWRRVTADA